MISRFPLKNCFLKRSGLRKLTTFYLAKNDHLRLHHLADAAGEDAEGRDEAAERGVDGAAVRGHRAVPEQEP